MGKSRVPETEIEFAIILHQLEPEEVQELYGVLQARRRACAGARLKPRPAVPRRWWYRCIHSAVVIGRDIR